MERAKRKYRFNYNNTKAFNKETELIKTLDAIFPIELDGDFLSPLYGMTLEDIVNMSGGRISMQTILRHHPMFSSQSSAVEVVYTVRSRNNGYLAVELNKLYNAYSNGTMIIPRYPYHYRDAKEIYYHHIYAIIIKFLAMYEVDSKRDLKIFTEAIVKAIHRVDIFRRVYPTEADLDKYLQQTLSLLKARRGYFGFVAFVKEK